MAGEHKSYYYVIIVSVMVGFLKMVNSIWFLHSVIVIPRIFIVFHIKCSKAKVSFG